MLPTTVLVHGLDSAKDTWTAVLSDLIGADYPALALDLRGPSIGTLGDPRMCVCHWVGAVTGR